MAIETWVCLFGLGGALLGAIGFKVASLLGAKVYGGAMYLILSLMFCFGALIGSITYKPSCDETVSTTVERFPLEELDGAGGVYLIVEENNAGFVNSFSYATVGGDWVKVTGRGAPQIGFGVDGPDDLLMTTITSGNRCTAPVEVRYAFFLTSEDHFLKIIEK